MLSLIVTILFALAIAYFAIQNTLGVPLVIANNIFPNVPLFFIVIGSVLLGVLMSSVINGLNSFSSYLTLRGKDHVIQQDAKAIHSLQNKINALEEENARLRTEEQPVVDQHIAAEEAHDGRVIDERVEEERHERTEDDRPAHRPSFFHNLFHPQA